MSYAIAESYPVAIVYGTFFYTYISYVSLIPFPPHSGESRCVHTTTYKPQGFFILDRGGIEMKITLERLRYKGSFNQQGYEELPNGNVVNTNEKLFGFWFGYYKQSLAQSVSSNAFDFLKDKVTIIARHNDYFVQAMDNTSYTITLPSPNSKTYHVASINPNYEVNGYDTIVLSAVGATTTTGGSSD